MGGVEIRFLHLAGVKMDFHKNIGTFIGISEQKYGKI